MRRRRSGSQEDDMPIGISEVPVQRKSSRLASKTKRLLLELKEKTRVELQVQAEHKSGTVWVGGQKNGESHSAHTTWSPAQPEWIDPRRRRGKKTRPGSSRLGRSCYMTGVRRR